MKIPTDQISMVEQDGMAAARLELRVMSLDKNGGQSEVAVLPVEIDGENAPSEGGFVVYKTLLKAPQHRSGPSRWASTTRWRARTA